jgi:hypothetical protein
LGQEVLELSSVNVTPPPPMPPTPPVTRTDSKFASKSTKGGSLEMLFSQVRKLA